MVSRTPTRLVKLRHPLVFDAQGHSSRADLIRVCTPSFRPAQGDRGREEWALPALRTVRAVFPHTALQSVVSSSGVSRRLPGCCEREQPGGSEEVIGPALMVDRQVAEAAALALPQQKRAQPPSDEPV